MRLLYNYIYKIASRFYIFSKLKKVFAKDKQHLILNYPFIHNITEARTTDYNTHINTNYIESDENLFIILSRINAYNNVIYKNMPWSSFTPLMFENLNEQQVTFIKKKFKINFLNFNIANDLGIYCETILNNSFTKVETTYKNFFKNFYNFNVLFFSKTKFYKDKFIFKNANFFKINYVPTDTSHYLNTNKLLNFFIRKNKIFNKGRYSRNRQLYRTGVYWCILLNVICVYGLYYYFYRFTFNFGYLYLYFFIFILSIFGSRLIKYRFYSINYILKEINWYMNIYTSIVINVFKKLPIRKYSIFFKNIFFKK